MSKLDQELKDQMINKLVDWDYDMQDSDSIKDMIVYGCKGYTEMDEQEFVEYFEQYVDSVSEDHDLLAKAKASLSVNKVLS